MFKTFVILSFYRDSSSLKFPAAAVGGPKPTLPPHHLTHFARYVNSVTELRCFTGFITSYSNVHIIIYKMYRVTY